MSISKRCDQCDKKFKTDNPSVNQCSWNCQRRALLKRRPDLATSSRALANVANLEGIIFERDVDGLHAIDLLMEQQEAEGAETQWQKDQKLAADQADEEGTRITEEQSWSKAARLSRERIADKYPSKMRREGMVDKPINDGFSENI